MFPSMDHVQRHRTQAVVRAACHMSLLTSFSRLSARCMGRRSGDLRSSTKLHLSISLSTLSEMKANGPNIINQGDDQVPLLRHVMQQVVQAPLHAVTDT
ncbi:hypothetical protein OUZ56_031591 [Daphnia magna]|uniref:Uncharacterized protein n=1 Tax=Daphnia magna TaxID=35525 RepID=A0ABQ9ZUP1_9CRUS|nr:hypothetical protein OUZ56_031591 [Daphnia magna]